MLRTKLASLGCDYFYAEFQVGKFTAIALCIYLKQPLFWRWLDWFLLRRRIIADVRPWMRYECAQIKKLSTISWGAAIRMNQCCKEIEEAVPGRVDWSMGLQYAPLHILREVPEPKSEKEWWGTMPIISRAEYLKLFKGL